MKHLVVCAAAALALAACASPTSSRYDAADVGRTIETMRGSVVASRPVRISGEPGPVGAGAGAVLGGAGAYGASGGVGWLSVIGAVVGAGAGYAAQQIASNRDGIEYIVTLEDGRTVTLVQNRDSGETPIANGTPVLVQISGKYTRVVPDPRADAYRPMLGAPGGGWVDPDKVGGPAATSGQTGAATGAAGTFGTTGTAGATATPPPGGSPSTGAGSYGGPTYGTTQPPFVIGSQRQQ